MGFLRVRFEGTAIYLSKDDAEYGITSNGFHVLLNPRKYAEYDKCCVLLEGTFDKDNMGHMSAWQGSLWKIKRIHKLEKQD